MRICIKNRFKIPEELYSPAFSKHLTLEVFRLLLSYASLFFFYIAPNLANTKLQEVMCNKGQKQVHFIWLLVQSLV